MLCKYRGTYVTVSVTDGRLYRYITISVFVVSLRYVLFLWLSIEINRFVCVFILLGVRKHHYTNSSILLTYVGSVFFPRSEDEEEVCFICKVPNRVVAKLTSSGTVQYPHHKYTRHRRIPRNVLYSTIPNRVDRRFRLTMRFRNIFAGNVRVVSSTRKNKTERDKAKKNSYTYSDHDG